MSGRDAGGSQPPSPGALRERDAPLHVLVVDDDPDHTAALAQILSLHGWQASRAHGGEDALRVLDAAHIDAMVCDLSLGAGMDGFEVARQVRALHGDAVLLAAYSGRSIARERVLDAGFDLLLTKPTPVAVLLETLSTAVRERRRCIGGRGGGAVA